MEEREKWVSTLESYKRESSGGAGHTRLRRQGSTLSLTSNTFSSHSTNSSESSVPVVIIILVVR